MKKTILFVVTLFLLFTPFQAHSQPPKVFIDSLEPSDPELKEQVKKITQVDKVLNSLIEDLREKYNSFDSNTDQETQKAIRTDLASLILLKVVLLRDLPYEQLEDLLNETYDLLPGEFPIEAIWGDVHFSKKDFENAIIHYENALNKNPNDINTIGKCAMAYFQKQNHEKALEYAELYLAKNPNEFFFLWIAGKCEYEQSNFDEAIDYLEKALEVCKDKNDSKTIEEYIRRAKEALASTGDFTQDEDQRFVITFAGDSANDIGDITFDMLNDIYYDVTNLLNYYPDVRINVVFFQTDDYYKEGKNWSAASTAGIKIMVPLKSGYKSEDYVKGLLAHEFTHAIINLKTNCRAPMWVHEGLAQYQEYSTENGSPESLRSDFEGTLQRDFIEGELFIPLDKVPAYIGSSDRKNVNRGYIASYLAIRCMADNYGEQSFDSLLAALGKGKDIREAVKEATGSEYSDFQEEYKEWVKNL